MDGYSVILPSLACLSLEPFTHSSALGIRRVHSIYRSWAPTLRERIIFISIYTLSDLGVLRNLTGSLSLANEHYSPPTE